MCLDTGLSVVYVCVCVIMNVIKKEGGGREEEEHGCNLATIERRKKKESGTPRTHCQGKKYPKPIPKPHTLYTHTHTKQQQVHNKAGIFFSWVACFFFLGGFYNVVWSLKMVFRRSCVVCEWLPS